MGADWGEVQRRIGVIALPGRSIPKCDGLGRRILTAHDAAMISMQTGASTKQTKAISYEMIEYAVAVLNGKGRLTSTDFRQKWPREYAAAPCRFSMTGGVLVEAGVAVLVPRRREGSCVSELV
jgi:hypothetical protein